MLAFALEMYLSFLRIGLSAFGGGTATIPLMDHELVATKGWLTSQQLAANIALGSMTPGPISVDTMVLNGYTVAGPLGSLIALLGLFTPPVVVVSIVIVILRRYAHLGFIATLQKAVQPGAFGLVLMAVVTVAAGNVEQPDIFTVYFAGQVHPLIEAAAAVARNIPNLLVVLAAFVLFIWKRQKIHPALTILAFGVLGILIF